MAQKILVVDDKPFMLRLIQHHLQRAGYQLITARNRQEAVQAMHDESPQLVVLDDMPQNASSPDGFDQFKGDGQESIPVIRMTEVPPGMENGSINNAQVVLTKPFSPTQLISEIKKLISESNCA